MKTKYFNIFSLSLIFGLICYKVCTFFVDQQVSLLLAIFTFGALFIVLLVNMKSYMKKVNIIDLSDIDNISFKDMANYYTNRLIGNGILILTLERLVFIPTENKKVPRVQFLLHEIQKVSYDKIFRHIRGVKIELRDGSSIGFVTQRYKEVLELLNLKNEHNLL